MTRTALALAVVLATSSAAFAGFDANSIFEYPTYYPEFPLTATPPLDHKSTGSIVRTKRPTSHLRPVTRTKSLARGHKTHHAVRSTLE
jgi:hypothetical protein